ncbi:MAG: TlpA family protein disulfide reductase [Acidimicrobiales bacterium]|nr:TlpA family protein disulfide reductase [Acidimicrobiales bacterium]MCB9392991.1 TlpA family protein disulfide reductase [Acidimicrobiaceae bacterium]
MSEPGGTVVGESDGPAASEVPSRRLAPFVALAVALVLAGLFVVLAGSDGGGGDSVESFLIGRPAPSVVSTTLDDEPFDLSRRKGSWVVINFFDPSCVPCVAEHPELVALADQQAQIADGAEVYTIVNRGTDESVQAFFDANGGDWPIVRDPSGSASVAFGVAQVPETWIIDPFGVVRARWAGEITADAVGAQLQAMREGRA